MRKLILSLLITMLSFTYAWAGDPEPTILSNKAAIDLVQNHANYLWTLVAACLVFFMQAGFALVESGFTRAKNAVNIMMKNLMDFSIGSIAFWAVGFGLMFGASETGWFGTSGFFLSDFTPDGDPWVLAFWMFQVVFAATAATIVSGAMAERTRFQGYIIYSIFISALIYPVFGSWAWGSLFNGQGWLEGLGFIDFAGSTVVHSVGGWAALAGAIVLGPRIGKYKDGRVNPFPGSNLALATLGTFILWLGWFGFNGGSVLKLGDIANSNSVAMVFLNTNAAAAGGVIVALIVARMMFGKADLTMALNGALAGLVAITAEPLTPAPLEATLIGAIGGALVVFAIITLDKMRIDDPVGAISVHGVVGMWGLIAVCFTNPDATWMAQLTGLGAIFGWTLMASLITWGIIKMVIGIRVSEEEEFAGVDLSECGLEAYPEFVGSQGSGK